METTKTDDRLEHGNPYDTLRCTPVSRLILDVPLLMQYRPSLVVTPTSPGVEPFVAVIALDPRYHFACRPQTLGSGANILDFRCFDASWMSLYEVLVSRFALEFSRTVIESLLLSSCWVYRWAYANWRSWTFHCPGKLTPGTPGILTLNSIYVLGMPWLRIL